jgi:hypothetical protein
MFLNFFQQIISAGLFLSVGELFFITNRKTLLIGSEHAFGVRLGVGLQMLSTNNVLLQI